MLQDTALAIHGGAPIRRTLLPYGRQQIDEEDIRSVVEVLRSDWLTSGPKIGEFEEAFASCVGAKYAVAVSSGTAALHAAAYAAGIDAGAEAITSPMTFCATANCILYTGGQPVLADVSDDTLNIDPDEIRRRLTSKTKAILPVDYAGHPAELDAILHLAADRELVVIEDACHALGAQYKQRPSGSISHMTVFSCHPVKHVTTGEGGVITTDDAGIAERLRQFRNHGINSEARERQMAGRWFYEVDTLGYNYRLTDIASALGLSQLRKLDANLARRREIAARYGRSLSDLKEIRLPIERTEVSSAWHLYPIRLRLDRLRANRAEIFKALRAENIGVNVHYIPVHYHPYYRSRFGWKPRDHPVAEAAYEELISIPMFHSMTDEDVKDTVDALQKVITHYRC